MTGIRNKKRKNPFVQIDKKILSDEQITWKAKGILSYLLSKPDNWITYVSDLEKQSTDGRDSVRSGMDELEKAGYISRKRIRVKGQFKGWEYEVYERPYGIYTENGKTDIGITDDGETNVGEPATSNNDLSNNDLSNKEIESESTNTDIPAPYIPTKEIISCLNANAKRNYRASSKKTQDLIKARLNEGFTLEDFRKVIINKAKQWITDPKMSIYLRPETLFGTKFESYLNENPSSYEQGQAPDPQPGIFKLDLSKGEDD